MDRKHEGIEVKEWAKEQRISLPSLAEDLGMTKQNLYHHLKNAELEESFRLKLEKYKENKFTHPGKQEKGDRVPFYEIDASAGAVEMFNDDQETPAAYFDIPFFKDCDFYVRLYGDSMYPKLRNGDIIACKKTEKRIILYGEVYLVVTSSGLRTVKIIRSHENPSLLVLQSINSGYDPVTIEFDDIEHLYLVKGNVQQKTN